MERAYLNTLFAIGLSFMLCHRTATAAWPPSYYRHTAILPHLVGIADVIFTGMPVAMNRTNTIRRCSMSNCATRTPPQRFAAWLVFVGEFTDGKPVVLNVAGQRESKALGIQEAVKTFLIEVVTMLKE